MQLNVPTGLAQCECREARIPFAPPSVKRPSRRTVAGRDARAVAAARGSEGDPVAACESRRTAGFQGVGSRASSWRGKVAGREGY